MAHQPATRKRTRSKRDDKKPADRGTSQNDHGREPATFEQELARYLQERIKPGLNRGAIPLLARSIAKEIAHRAPGEDADVDDERGDDAEDDVRDEADDDVRGEADDNFSDEEDDDVRGEADDDFSDEEDDDVRDEEDDDVRGEADDDFSDEEDDDVRDEEDDDVRDEADDNFSDEDDGDDGEAPFVLEDELRDLQADLGDDWIVRVSVQGDDTWLTAEKDDGSQHVEAASADVLADVVGLLESGGRSS